VAVALAGAGAISALLRTGLTFREVRALADARMQARTDELTGLPNRRSFLEHTQAAVERRRPTGRFVLLLIDLDRFKEINDSFGHPMGDSMLRMVASRLSSVLRGSDVVARLGGDEFGILLADADESFAADVATRVRAALRQPFDLQGLSVTLDSSIGIALVSTPRRCHRPAATARGHCHVPGQGPVRQAEVRHPG
jgi:diguanylate cyclase (GGDEF)-like protein